jgi:hypothetical protein
MSHVACYIALTRRRSLREWSQSTGQDRHPPRVSTHNPHMWTASNRFSPLLNQLVATGVNIRKSDRRPRPRSNI